MSECKVDIDWRGKCPTFGPLSEGGLRSLRPPVSPPGKPHVDNSITDLHTEPQPQSGVSLADATELISMHYPANTSRLHCASLDTRIPSSRTGKRKIFRLFSSYRYLYRPPFRPSPKHVFVRLLHIENKLCMGWINLFNVHMNGYKKFYIRFTNRCVLPFHMDLIFKQKFYERAYAHM